MEFGSDFKITTPSSDLILSLCDRDLNVNTTEGTDINPNG